MAMMNGYAEDSSVRKTKAYHEDKGDKRETCYATAEPDDFTVRLSDTLSSLSGARRTVWVG